MFRVAWFPRLTHRSGEGTGSERLFVWGPKGDVAYIGDPNVRFGRSQRSAGPLRPSFGGPLDLSPGVARPPRAYSRNALAWGVGPRGFTTCIHSVSVVITDATIHAADDLK